MVFDHLIKFTHLIIEGAARNVFHLYINVVFILESSKVTYYKWTYLGIIRFKCSNFRYQMISLFHDQYRFFFNLFHCIFFMSYFVYCSDHISKVTYSNGLFKFKIRYVIFLLLRHIYLFNCRLSHFCRSLSRCICSLSALILVALNHFEFVFHAFEHWLPWWLVFGDLAEAFGAY